MTVFDIDPGLAYAVYAEVEESDAATLRTNPANNPEGYENWYGAGVNVDIFPVGVFAPSAVGTPAIPINITVQPVGFARPALSGTAIAAANQPGLANPAGVSSAALSGTVSVTIGTTDLGNGFTIDPGLKYAIYAEVDKSDVTILNTAPGSNPVGHVNWYGINTDINANVIPIGVIATALARSPTVAVGQSIVVAPTGVTTLAQTGTASVLAKRYVTVSPAGVTAVAALGTATATGKTYVSTLAVGVTAVARVGSVSVTAVQLNNGLPIWNGTAWVRKPVKVWTGSAWVSKPVKTWTGSVWKKVG